MFAVCVLVACSPPPRPKLAPERDAPDSAKPVAPRSGKQFPAAPAGFATANLVALYGGELTAYTLVGGTLKATGTTTLVKVAKGDEDEVLMLGIGHGAWADRDHLFVTIGKREVVMVTATEITEVSIPNEDTFKTPKPPPGPDGIELDAGDPTGSGDIPFTGLIVTRGEAWWAACPWGLAVDGFHCRNYVNARLWPTAKVTVDAPPLTPIKSSWPSSIPGYTVKTIDPKSITCESLPGKKVTITADYDPTQEIESVHWVSTSPPRLLVKYGHADLADIVPDSFTLHDGCTQAPLVTGGHAVPGPGGWWISTIGADQVVYRFSEHVGQFPYHARVWLRP